jgi:uncharacterized protein with ATP-grasp and redox domains
MRAGLPCYPCFFTQILKTSRLLGLSEAQTREAVLRFSRRLPDYPPGASPAGIGRDIYLILSEISGNRDPYAEVKDRCTRSALRIYPDLKRRVREAADPLREAVRIAVAGNFIDFGTSGNVDLKAGLGEILDQYFMVDHYQELRRSLEAAGEVLMLADNAGETVFDRILIEEMEKPVRYAVREAPMINDAVRSDAEAAGIDLVADIVSSGCVAPGTIREFCSRKFWETLERAEVIISKGQGNYEGLSHETLPVYFLFKAKCASVAQEMGVPIGSNLILRSPHFPDSTPGSR